MEFHCIMKDEMILFLNWCQFMFSVFPQIRTEYLSLLHQILMNSDYSERKHQANELMACLERISQEDDKESEKDKIIAEEILKTCIKCFND